ncbi:unnamed protein product [Gongylonema pulchrum]|uniref:Bicarbonate transporter-like transmembrane domain-containing protein n=1 Tax=Gongylonema pulchrum TaxID=637853 RepID=A0A3P7MJB5_9BILA|nr:unnamed protein product [Gongylonema pulchrum]
MIADVRKVITAQALGGIFFAIFGGQPMIILLTTVPLAIYIKAFRFHIVMPTTVPAFSDL